MRTKNAAVKAFALLGAALVLLLMFSLGGRGLAVLGLFWAVAGGFIWATGKYKLKAAYVCAGVFLLSFLFQSCYSGYVRILGEGDLQFYYGSAVSIAENGFRLESLYHAAFPGTVTYPSVVAVLFRIAGVYRIVPVLFNQVVMSATAVLVYVFAKRRHGHACGAVCAMLLATHPFVIIYCNAPNAEILYGACILWSFITFCFARERYRHTGQKLRFIVPALFLGLSLLFRPMGVILLIALLLYTVLFSGAKIKDAAVICSILIAGFFAFNLLCGVIVKGVTSYAAPQSAYGWNLYIGASETGRWNQADAEEFTRVIETAETPSALQRHFAGEAFARYREMGLGVFAHGSKKLLALNSAEYMIQETLLLTEESAARHTLQRIEYSLPVYLYYVPILLLALLFCLWSFVRLLRGERETLLILPLYTVGSFAAFAFLEVAPRYGVSYHIMFTVLAFEAALGAVQYIRKAR
ncbi:MAG: glycosyltransferase family 39 protein [Oscillospiraceae bacterium]|nr:glycosyltransferase family 39 protein [Oscillospiraceae bacterium]